MPWNPGVEGPWAALRKRQSQDPREIGSGALVAALTVGVTLLRSWSRRRDERRLQAARLHLKLGCVPVGVFRRKSRGRKGEDDQQ